MDYLREDNAELVGFALTALDDALVREVPGARWAEPDIDEAAAALRRVVHDYRSACQRAWSGRSLVTRRFSRKTAAKVLERRLGFVAAETFRGKTRRSQK
jgi:hypothetical protein